MLSPNLTIQPVGDRSSMLLPTLPFQPVGEGCSERLKLSFLREFGKLGAEEGTQAVRALLLADGFIRKISKAIWQGAQEVHATQTVKSVCGG